jgi:hypothetical protein
MAQHDYAIANQGFPAFRSDLNDALAAIVSNNSGATEPTTMFAHQLWVDTAANPSILKIRNADNDAWITIGSIDQTGDTFTLVNLRTSGPVVFNDAGADVDFRVEGDTDANLLFVDAGNDRVGIGTSSPVSKLNISVGTDKRAAVLSSSAYSNSVDFVSINDGGSEIALGIAGTPIQFFTQAIERARIDSSGTVGINNLGPSSAYKLVVNGATGGTAALQVNAGSNTDGAYIINPSGASVCLVINHEASAGTTKKLISGFHSVFGVSATESFIVYNNGNVQNTNNSYGAISDIKLKENIVDATPKLADLMQVKVRNYNLIGDTAKQLGVVAQELETVFPSMIDESPDYITVTKTREVEAVFDDERNEITSATTEEYTEQEATGTTTKSVKYSVFVPMLIKAIQELSAKNDALEARIAALENA